MKLLLHTCCGPCSIFPVSELRNYGIDVHGYFYNPNIHPYREFKKRIEGMEQFAQTSHLSVDIDRGYGLTEYLRKVVFHEQQRCPLCYAMRLNLVAQKAREWGYDSFSTTLLYSKYQDHDCIRKTGEDLAHKHQVDFYYQDFRIGWQEGVDRSLEMELYRQPYCGCIYSEQERYDKNSKKVFKK